MKKTGHTYSGGKLITPKVTTIRSATYSGGKKITVISNPKTAGGGKTT